MTHVIFLHSRELNFGPRHKFSNLKTCFNTNTDKQLSAPVRAVPALYLYACTPDQPLFGLYQSHIRLLALLFDLCYGCSCLIFICWHCCLASVWLCLPHSVFISLHCFLASVWLCLLNIHLLALLSLPNTCLLVLLFSLCSTVRASYSSASTVVQPLLGLPLHNIYLVALLFSFSWAAPA